MLLPVIGKEMLSVLGHRDSLHCDEPRFTSPLWRLAVVVTAALLVALLLLYWKTAALMAEMWRAPSYSHCYLIFPVTLYLVWLRRERLICLTPRPNPWGLVLFAALSFAWLLGALAEVLVLQRLALVGMVPALVWAVLGTDALRELRFPLAFLFFTVPVGDSLVPHLQDLTAGFAVKALDLVGVPVLLEGRILTVRSGTWEVAGACSGIRFLITSLVIGFLYAGLALQTWKRRILLLVIAVVVPILANGFRVFGIVILGEYRGDAASAYFHHVTYGWLFFSVVTILLLVIGSRLREQKETQTVPAVSIGDASLPAETSVSQGPSGPDTSARAITATALAALILLASAPIAQVSLDKATPERTSLPANSITVTGPWMSLDTIASEWTPQFVGTSSVLQRAYVSGPGRVDLYIAYYSPRDGTKLASSGNAVYLEPQWQRISEGVSIPVLTDKAVRVHETVVRSARTSCLIWSWYWVGGEFTQSEYRAKYLLARSRLFADKRGGAAIAVASDFTFDRSEAESTLRDFLTHSAFFADSRGRLR